MIAVLDELRRGVESLQRLLRKSEAIQISSIKTRASVGNFVRSYFERIRKSYLDSRNNERDLLELDSLAQELLRCAQHRTSRTVYIAVLKQMSHAISKVEIRAISAPIMEQDLSPDKAQQKILETLRKLSPSAAASYEQGLRDLADPNRLSWRGPAVDFREALREILDLMASDEVVTSQPGFRLEPGTAGPTMKQKSVFILRSRRQKDTQIKPFSGAIDILEELIGKFVRSVYSRSSLAVHIQVSREETRKIADYVSLVLKELLEIKT